MGSPEFECPEEENNPEVASSLGWFGTNYVDLDYCECQALGMGCKQKSVCKAYLDMRRRVDVAKQA